MNRIIGKFEQVSFPEFGISKVIAKVDTGAYSGALHSSMIKEVRGPKGMELRFSPFDNPEVVITSHDYEVGSVRSSNGQVDSRYYITTTVRVQNRNYPVRITLSNRSSMRYPVLLGRRFLEENKFLVDVSLDNR
jgi:hypothetical protein